MCLGIPGKVVEIIDDPMGMNMGKVNFGGIQRDVCLAYVPDVKVGEYVIVHVGFAINKVDEDEAMEVFEMLRQMGELEELAPPAPA